MKVTKAFFITLVAAGGIIACGSALAQDSTNAPVSGPSTNNPTAAPRMMPRGPSMESLARALDLTDAQKAQVQPIITEENKKMRDVRNDTSLSVQDKRVKMKEIRDETTTELQPILTPEQLEKWKSRNRQHRPRPQAAPNASTNPPAGSAP